jgi:hypothetical protein
MAGMCDPILMELWDVIMGRSVGMDRGHIGVRGRGVAMRGGIYVWNYSI